MYACICKGEDNPRIGNSQALKLTGVVLTDARHKALCRQRPQQRFLNFPSYHPPQCSSLVPLAVSPLARSVLLPHVLLLSPLVSKLLTKVTEEKGKTKKEMRLGHIDMLFSYPPFKLVLMPPRPNPLVKFGKHWIPAINPRLHKEKESSLGICIY